MEGKTATDRHDKSFYYKYLERKRKFVVENVSLSRTV
jgi:hypothetical protein